MKKKDIRRLFTGVVELKGVRKPGYVLVRGDRIEAVGFGAPDSTLQLERTPREDFPAPLVIRQGDFNAHSHPEQSIYVEDVDSRWDLGTWCRKTIYRYSPYLSPDHVRLACRRAFSRMVLYGVSSVMVSFYLHNRQGNRYDREVIAAARDVGVRLIFGRMTYDMVSPQTYEAKWLSQESYFETCEEGEAYLRELMEEEGPDVVVAPAVHSMHASSGKAIARALILGAELERPVQFHLSEDRGDVDIALKSHGCRPVVYLDSLVRAGDIPDLDRLVVSDCCWVDDRERRLLADHGATVVLNPRMNARIGVGQADLPGFLKAGIPVFLGTDGEASNDDLSVEGERAFLRRTYDGLVAADVVDELGRSVFPFGDGEIGPLAPGRFCDFRVDDPDGVRHLFVGGEAVVWDRRLVRLDMERDIEMPLKREMAVLRKTLPPVAP